MTEQINNDQIIIETKVLLKTLTERVDRHSMEHAAGIERIYRELKEIREFEARAREEDRKARTDLETRVTKLETEKNIGLKIMVPMVSAFFGAVSAWLTAFFHRGQ